MATDSGTLKKMQIQAYSDPKFQTKSGSALDVLINPTNYSKTYKIVYDETQPPGASGGSPKFKKIASDDMSFQLVYDATGVVDSSKTDLASQIDDLKDTVYEYDGDTHEPKYLQLVWGELLYECRLASLTVNYTLFKPSGVPLRAKVDAQFTAFTDPETLASEAKKNSPDLSHIIRVKSGDTLPLLCYQVYKNSSLYLKVARFNKLPDFRNIQPGQQLIFPPLK